MNEETVSKCNCWCRGDLYKAPEQHTANCPESLQSRRKDMNALNKKIKVPDGMLAAAREATGIDPYNVMPMALKAALLWLSSNPIVPTDDQLESLDEALIKSAEAQTEGVWDGRRELIREWQQRMFLAPEINPVVRQVRYILAGSTLTAGDAAELMDVVQRCAKPETANDQSDTAKPHTSVI